MNNLNGISKKPLTLDNISNAITSLENHLFNPSAQDFYKYSMDWIDTIDKLEIDLNTLLKENNSIPNFGSKQSQLIIELNKRIRYYILSYIDGFMEQKKKQLYYLEDKIYFNKIEQIIEFFDDYSKLKAMLLFLNNRINSIQCDIDKFNICNSKLEKIKELLKRLLDSKIKSISHEIRHETDSDLTKTVKSILQKFPDFRDVLEPLIVDDREYEIFDNRSELSGLSEQFTHTTSQLEEKINSICCSCECNEKNIKRLYEELNKLESHYNSERKNFLLKIDRETMIREMKTLKTEVKNDIIELKERFEKYNQNLNENIYHILNRQIQELNIVEISLLWDIVDGMHNFYIQELSTKPYIEFYKCNRQFNGSIDILKSIIEKLDEIKFNSSLTQNGRNIIVALTTELQELLDSIIDFMEEKGIKNAREFAFPEFKNYFNEKIREYLSRSEKIPDDIKERIWDGFRSKIEGVFSQFRLDSDYKEAFAHLLKKTLSQPYESIYSLYEEKTRIPNGEFDTAVEFIEKKFAELLKGFSVDLIPMPEDKTWDDRLHQPDLNKWIVNDDSDEAKVKELIQPGILIKVAVDGEEKKIVIKKARVVVEGPERYKQYA